MLLTFTAALCFAAFGSIHAAAFSDDIFSDLEILGEPGFSTYVTDTENEVHVLNGVIDAEKIEHCRAADRIASYEVYYGNEKLLKTELNDIIPKNAARAFSADNAPNGYYSIKFQLSSEDNTEAFITGLSDSNINLVQNELINARLSDSDLSIEHIDFIDAEKTLMPNDGDDLLCWAASAANILHYTGWGAKAGFSGPDDMMDEFVKNFTDEGSDIISAIEWFFDGTYSHDHPLLRDLYPNYSKPKHPGTSGNFLPDYSSWDIIRSIEFITGCESMQKVIQDLEDGCGVYIGLTSSGIGHAVTGWGYITDNDFDENDSRRYKALIVSDSDTDMTADPDRRLAPNKLNIYNMEPYNEDGADTWKLDDGYDSIFDEFESFIPYSGDVKYETDPNAAKNKFDFPDLAAKKISLANDAGESAFSQDIFSTDDDIYIFPTIANYGYMDSDATDYTVNIKNRGGDIINYYTAEMLSEQPPYMTTEAFEVEKINIGKLPAGDYTTELIINPDKKIREAYYYNNTSEADFKVAEPVYDLSGVSVNASLGGIEHGKAEFSFTYSGLNIFYGSENTEYTLKSSYYENGKWSDWEVCDTESDKTAPPEKFNANARGEKIRFRIAININENTPIINLYSDEYELKYTMLSIEADETDPVNLTVKRGENFLTEDEYFSFIIKNISTENSGNAECSAAVYAEKGDEKIELFRKNDISVPYGQESDVIKFNSWTAKLSGTYAIIVSLESDYGDIERKIAVLAAEEKISYEVTIGEDITDPYDDNISLREAVSYLKEYGGADDKITFSENTLDITISEPIKIDSPINIDSLANHDKGIAKSYVMLLGDYNNPFFNITKDGSLNAVSLRLYSGYSQDNGGAINNDGGSINITQCIFELNKSDGSGGAIYSNGGNITLKNCSFKTNSSSCGGAIYMENNADVNMLNCNIFNCSSNGGAVCNDGGSLTAVYSAFAGNENSSAGGSAVTSSGNTGLIGCIVADESSVQLSGSVNVYGSYLTSHDSRIVTDGLTVYGTVNDIFKADESGKTDIKFSNITETLSYYAKPLSPVLNGILVKNINGNTAYSKDGASWIKTSVPSVFTDEEYLKDIHGKEHGRLFGSCADAEGKPDDPSAGDTGNSGGSGGSGNSNNNDKDTENNNNDDNKDKDQEPDKDKDDNNDNFSRPAPFTDVKESNWFCEAVAEVFNSGIMKGVSAAEFAPHKNMSRAMFVTALYRLEKEPESSADLAFGDVSADKYYADAVRWASSNNIVKGYSADNFAPENNITREQMAAIIYRYAEFKGFNMEPTGSLNYSDIADISDYAKDSVIWCLSADIMHGNTDNTFKPKANTTRAQAAAVLTRISKLH